MKILIVEDERVSRMVLAAALEKLGHDVIEAEDGLVGWEQFEKNTPPVVVTDWAMPGLDGLQLCRKIRERDSASYTYVFILTKLSGRDRFFEGMDAGADDFLTKPFDPAELAARLRVAQRILGLRLEVQRLEGLLPICSYCKRIRDEANEWSSVEQYVSERFDACFTHSICPDCYTSHALPQIAQLPTLPE